MSWRWQIIFPQLSKTVGTTDMHLSFDDLIDFHGWLSVKRQDWLNQSFRWHRFPLLSTRRPRWWMAPASRLLMIHKLHRPTASHQSPLSIPLVTALSLLLDQVLFLCQFYIPRARPCVDWGKGYLVGHGQCFFQLAEFCLCGLLVFECSLSTVCCWSWMLSWILGTVCSS